MKNYILWCLQTKVKLFVMHALATWYMTTLPVVGDTFISVSKCTEGFSFQITAGGQVSDLQGRIYDST